MFSLTFDIYVYAFLNNSQFAYKRLELQYVNISVEVKTEGETEGYFGLLSAKMIFALLSTTSL